MKLVSITTCAFAVAAFAIIAPAPLRAQDQSTTIQASAASRSSLSPDLAQSHVDIKQWRGQYGDEKAHTEVFATSEAWEGFWKHLDMASHDQLDEKTQMGVCIYIGERSTLGFKPYIVSAVERDGKMVVSYSTGQPAPRQMVAREVSHPWVAAIIPKSSLPIVFKEI